MTVLTSGGVGILTSSRSPDHKFPLTTSSLLVPAVGTLCPFVVHKCCH